VIQDIVAAPPKGLLCLERRGQIGTHWSTLQICFFCDSVYCGSTSQRSSLLSEKRPDWPPPTEVSYTVNLLLLRFRILWQHLPKVSFARWVKARWAPTEVPYKLTSFVIQDIVAASQRSSLLSEKRPDWPPPEVPYKLISFVIQDIVTVPPKGLLCSARRGQIGPQLKYPIN
jgi:hypothetical protein